MIYTYLALLIGVEVYKVFGLYIGLRDSVAVVVSKRGMTMKMTSSENEQLISIHQAIN